MALTKFGTTLKILKVAALDDLKTGVPEFADTIQKIVAKKDDANFVFCWTRALTCDLPNANGDIFTKAEVIPAYPTFVGRNLHTDHNTQSVRNAVGKVFDAKLLRDPMIQEGQPGDYYVGCLIGVDASACPDLAKKVKSGTIDAVSMGCNVAEAECSICGKRASSTDQFCKHLQNLGRLDPESGKYCYSINHGLNYTELSLVGVPADPTAKIQQVFANISGQMLKKAEGLAQPALGTPQAAPSVQGLDEYITIQVPTANEKTAEQFYNLLQPYQKEKLIKDLESKDAVLKVSIKANSADEAISSLNKIFKEQGFDIEDPQIQTKEEISMADTENKDKVAEVQSTASTEVTPQTKTAESVVEPIKTEAAPKGVPDENNPDQKADDTAEEAKVIMRGGSDEAEVAKEAASAISFLSTLGKAIKNSFTKKAEEVTTMSELLTEKAPAATEPAPAPTGGLEAAAKPGEPKEDAKPTDKKDEKPADAPKGPEAGPKKDVTIPAADFDKIMKIVNEMEKGEMGQGEPKDTAKMVELKDLLSGKNPGKGQDILPGAPAPKGPEAPKADLFPKLPGAPAPAAAPKADAAPAPDAIAPVAPTAAFGYALLKKASPMESEWIIRNENNHAEICGISLEAALGGDTSNAAKVAYVSSEKFAQDICHKCAAKGSIYEDAVLEVIATYEPSWPGHKKFKAPPMSIHPKNPTNSTDFHGTGTDEKLAPLTPVQKPSGDKTDKNLTVDKGTSNIKATEHGGQDESGHPKNQELSPNAGETSKKIAELSGMLKKAQDEVSRLKYEKQVEAKVAKARALTANMVKNDRLQINEAYRVAAMKKGLTAEAARKEALELTAEDQTKVFLSMSDLDLVAWEKSMLNVKASATVETTLQKPLKVEASQQDENGAVQILVDSMR